jgi:hypothetical protein
MCTRKRDTTKARSGENRGDTDVKEVGKKYGRNKGRI